MEMRVQPELIEGLFYLVHPIDLGVLVQGFLLNIVRSHHVRANALLTAQHAAKSMRLHLGSYIRVRGLWVVMRAESQQLASSKCRVDSRTSVKS